MFCWSQGDFTYLTIGLSLVMLFVAFLGWVLVWVCGLIVSWVCLGAFASGFMFMFVAMNIALWVLSSYNIGFVCYYFDLIFGGLGFRI